MATVTRLALAMMKGGGDKPTGGGSALAWMLLAMATIPIADAIAKYLTRDYPLMQIAWVGFAIHAGCLIPLVSWRLGWRALWPKQAALQLLRGGFLVADVILFFAAIAVLPLADTLAIFFISPLVVVAFSVLLLGERVGPRRWIAVFIGFFGALVIIRPGFGVFHPASLFAVGSGIAYALYMVVTRKLAGSDPPLVTLAHTAIFGAVAMAFVMPFVWIRPDWFAAGLMLAMGLLAALSHYFLVLAFDSGSASFLAPFTYTAMIGAVAIGYLVFADFPDHWTWAGMAIIALSGIYISRREGRD